ncbi:MAG: threonylcarbamoyl-AMP synthase [Ruminococcaceae bacterium]|nr:threonylcarbamoyl-AMP synthase [Oscillospiraceae bacterium]
MEDKRQRETVYAAVCADCLTKKNESLALAGKLLREGGTVIFPTETVYGLGANALDPDAAARIYAAKGRPADNPLIVHIAEPEEADTLCDCPPLYARLARAFMPGPLTVIMTAKPCVPKTVTAGLPTVAVRCPAHPVAHALLLEAGVPVAAPSANLSGSPSPTCFLHVKEDMDGRVDMIIDGGECDYGVESTIVKLEEDGTLLLLRPGAVTLEDLTAFGARVTVAPAVLGALKEGETVLSPGMKYRHYAPEAPLYLLDGSFENIRKFLADREGRVAYLAYDEEMASIALPHVTLYSLGEMADTPSQAKSLFRILREADKENYDAIYAPLPSIRGLGMALYNRMIRAAAHQIIKL